VNPREYHNPLVSDEDLANATTPSSSEERRLGEVTEVGSRLEQARREASGRKIRTWPRKGAAFYPWDLWMDGKWHTITYGTDFVVTNYVMVNMLHNRARMKGVAVKTETTPDYSIMFRFFESREAMETILREETEAAENRYADIDPHLEMDR